MGNFKKRHSLFNSLPPNYPFRKKQGKKGGEKGDVMAFFAFFLFSGRFPVRTVRFFCFFYSKPWQKNRESRRTTRPHRSRPPWRGTRRPPPVTASLPHSGTWPTRRRPAAPRRAKRTLVICIAWCECIVATSERGALAAANRQSPASGARWISPRPANGLPHRNRCA